MHDVTREESVDDGKYYTDANVAALLGVTVARLRNKVCAGDPLPPRIQPPGCRQRLWPRNEVHAWLDRYTVMTADTGPHYRRRGRRPTMRRE